MEFAFPAVLIVPLALGLLGFVEPCTVGAHLVFLRTIVDRPISQRANAMLIFASVRILLMGSFGALIAVAGRQLIEVQTGMWLVFGALYLLIGIAFASGLADTLKMRVGPSSSAWFRAGHPAFLGAAFGLNIPACAAPILFGLLAVAASSGTMALGFLTMAVFALALSVPLALLVIWPAAISLLARLTTSRRQTRWIASLVFFALGVWSLWFGLYVDPADWAAL